MSGLVAWSKLPSNWNQEARYFDLLDELGDAAKALPPALWAFCSSIATDGDLSGFTADRIARRLDYDGPSPAAMLEVLKRTGYVTPEGKVADWEVLFPYPRYKEKCRAAGLASAEKRREKSDADHSDQIDQTDRREREKDNHVERGVQRDVEHGAKPRALARPDLSEWLAYASDLGWSAADATAAFDHYAANGWKQTGGNVIKDWKAAARNCSRRSAPGSGQAAPGRPAQAESVWTLRERQKAILAEMRQIEAKGKGYRSAADCQPGEQVGSYWLPGWEEKHHAARVRLRDIDRQISGMEGGEAQ